ncbi:sensor histidine kinase [Cellulomonas sp. C5510]|uniref:sensor histidine kinase n=1 Tax=Cellulomonas sp. C5510 TaxID=2871170 RepID=UPI001C98D947|nr:histidine kinase [Cellulomonas sp. C5510]QZN85328.1 sensor histidine kinase [Cellulomonas sp. C5510]
MPSLPRLDDRGVALLYLAAGLLLHGAGISVTGAAVAGPAGWWLHTVLLLVACGALTAKRRHPVAVLAVAAACVVGTVPAGGGLGLLLVLVDALYSAEVHASARARRALHAVVAALTVAAPAAVWATGGGLRDALAAALQAVAVLVTPLWWGSDVRSRTELAASEAERATLERARADLARAHAADVQRIADLDRDAAVRDERAGMARDLHDVVASRLSAVAIHAEAALSGPPDADRDRAALAAVRAESVASLAEMRSMILVLRGADPRDGATAPAGLDRLGDLVTTARQRGLDVRVAAAVPELPAVVDHAAYRIAREALTNAAAHGTAGGRVDLRVASDGSALEVVVVNGLPAADAPTPAVASALGSGTGLVSMAERARSLGGRFAAGPDAADRWRVHAVLPLAPGAPAEPVARRTAHAAGGAP